MKGVTIMPVGAMIFLGVILLVFTALDIFMLVSLLKPGDERNQIIVWKASSFTLLATIGSNMIDVIENFVKGQYMSTKPVSCEGWQTESREKIAVFKVFIDNHLIEVIS